MVDDAQLRGTDRIFSCMRQLQKIYKQDKSKQARDLLLCQALDGSSKCMEVLWRFKEDLQILQTFKTEATHLFQSHMSHTRYNACLLAAHLMC